MSAPKSILERIITVSEDIAEELSLEEDDVFFREELSRIEHEYASEHDSFYGRLIQVFSDHAGTRALIKAADGTCLRVPSRLERLDSGYHLFLDAAIFPLFGYEGAARPLGEVHYQEFFVH